MEILTKAQLLGGKLFSKVISIEGFGSIRVRALSDGEITAIDSEYIQEINAAGIKIAETSKSNVNDEQALIFQKTLKNKDWKSCALALSVDEEWTVDDVKQLPIFVIERINDESDILSKGEDKQLDKFRGDGGGSESVDVDGSGVQVN